MVDVVLSTYKRESNLWPHANLFYKLTDWVLMECIFRDMSKERERAKERKTKVTLGDKDITEEYYSDKYVIRLTNKGGFNHEEFEFTAKDEANKKYKEIMRHKVYGNFKKVKEDAR